MYNTSMDYNGSLNESYWSLQNWTRLKQLPVIVTLCDPGSILNIHTVLFKCNITLVACKRLKIMLIEGVRWDEHSNTR